jgi:2-keto-3-deoxy-L-fuconate dehydrogenase
VAADFIKRGIRVNAICSGAIESPSLGERVNEVSTKTGTPISEVAQSFTDPQPMDRLGRPEQVAGLAVLLASDAANYNTGHPHLVEGGMAL